MRLRPRALLPLAALTGLLTAGLAVPGASAQPAQVASAATGTGSAALRAQVAALQAEVAAAGDRLEAGARTYEQSEQRLAVLTQQQFGVQDDLERQQRASTTTRDDVDALVRAAYMGGGGVPPTVAALLSGDPRALADLDRVRRTVSRVEGSGRAALHDLTTSKVRSQALLQDRTRLRREALVAQQALDVQQQQVAAQATALAARLTSTSQRL
ncbi:MAG: hypothetical protein JWM64_2646, partial [Frankiales bacterium]|nr:hypothetical protein [Frankiales bacterium]